MTALTAHHKTILAEHGWLFLRDPILADDIHAVAKLLGPPVSSPGAPFIESLQPRSEMDARANTTSSIYGLNQFPLHTDMAHWPLPPRYLVMRASVVATSVPTLLVDSRDLELDGNKLNEWRRALWRVSRVHRPYLCSLFFQHDGIVGVRWDVCTMSPYGRVAMQIVSDVVAEMNDLLVKRPIRIDWSSSDELLVLDNWRMLHARPPVAASASNRTIQRAMAGVSTNE